MKRMTIPVKSDAKIEVKGSDDLSIQGIKGESLTAIVDQGECLKISERHDGLEVKATTDCRLIVPESTTITVEKAGGDLSVSSISGRVILGKVGGDLALRQVGGASIETIGGDVGFKQVEGTLEVARVGGDLDGETVAAVTCRAVGGDVILIDVAGAIDLVAGGDVEISSSAENLSTMKVQAGGDIKLIVSPKSSGQLELISKGEDISVHACGQDGDWEEEKVSLPLGNGGSSIQLHAGGDIAVTDHETVSKNFEDIFDRTEEDWKQFAVDLKKSVQESLAYASESVAQAMEKGMMAGEKAKMKIDMAANHRRERNRDKENRRTMVGFSYDEPGSKKEKSRGGASDEERMMVLRMLQEKKITPEEAEKLLNALD